MNTKLKWFSLFLMASFIVACDSGSSSDTDKEEVEDCSIDTDGTVKVFSPKGGEVFHIGDSITVKWVPNMLMVQALESFIILTKNLKHSI